LAVSRSPIWTVTSTSAVSLAAPPGRRRDTSARGVLRAPGRARRVPQRAENARSMRRFSATWCAKSSSRSRAVGQSGLTLRACSRNARAASIPDVPRDNRYRLAWCSRLSAATRSRSRATKARIASRSIGPVYSLAPRVRCVATLGHRQAKLTATDLLNLLPPRHFPTLPRGDYQPRGERRPNASCGRRGESSYTARVGACFNAPRPSCFQCRRRQSRQRPALPHPASARARLL